MITKTQIIQETYNFYSQDPVGRRSKINDNVCQYNGPNGTKCAFARCCDDIPKKFEGLGITFDEGQTTGFRRTKEIMTYLKPEYKHIDDLEFWADLQKLHDFSSNWNLEKNSASLTGVQAYEDLLEKYKNQ